MGQADLTYDDMDATTQKYYATPINQQSYDSNYLLDKIRKGKRVKVVTGGLKVAHPIRNRKLGLAGFVDPDDTYTTAKKNTRTLAELEWKYATVPIVMTWAEKARNRGQAAFVALLADKVKEGLQDMDYEWATAMYQAYASKGTNDIDGLLTICQSGSSSTYAGIAGSNASDWNPGVYDSSTTALALYGSGSLEVGVRSCTFRDPPDLMVTTRTIAGIYASKLQPSERRAPENGKSGATDLGFMGIPIMADAQGGSGDIHFISTKNLWLYVQAGYNFSTGKWEKDPNRLNADRCLISFMGNLMADTRKAFGAYTAIAS